MSLINDEKNDPTITDNIMEYEDREDKVKVEEVYINLGCVKEEIDEESSDLEGSVIGFEHNVLMEEVFVKSEDIKQEITTSLTNSNIFYCNKCGGNYEGYCSNCSTLSHVLNKIIPKLYTESNLDALPTDILQIKDVSIGKGVFTLKILPNGVIFGPFEGALTSTNGWRIKDNKFMTDQNANWMKFVACASDQFSKNLDIFQLEGKLYFQTNREIKAGEELLICYIQEVMIKLENEEECYFVPVEKEESSKIFACTLCCLGFRLESCLVEHKSKCPNGEQDGNVEDFEIIECSGCKLWLEKEEHQGHHMLYCFEKTRTWSSSTNSQGRNQVEVDVIRGIDENPTPISEDEDAIGQNMLDNETSNGSDRLRNILECKVCNKVFSKPICLKQHIRNLHSYALKQIYKCWQCSFQSEYKSSLDRHLITHTNVRAYPCEMCDKKFVNMSNLKDHTRYQHSLTSEKEFKCPKCSYETNRKGNLKLHLTIHSSVKEKKHKCEKCAFQTNFKSVLNKHLYKHEDKQTKEKDYKCPHCSFQTFYKWSLKTHVNTHKIGSTNMCKDGNKSDWNVDIKTEYLTNAEEQTHKCSECPFQTNYEDCFKDHMNTHDIKPFQCDVCKKKFREKKNVYQHIRYEHSSRTNEKKFKCLACSYQTNYKNNLMSHVNTHKDVKPYRCEICDKSYSGKTGLKYHMQKLHFKIKEESFE